MSFWDQVEVQPNGCWLWPGAVTSSGHGSYYFYNKHVGPHKYAYESYYNVRVNLGYDVHHKCLLKLCINPFHLEVLTHVSHSNKHHPQKTHCLHGHEFTQNNTYLEVNRGRWLRVCLICKRQRARLGTLK